MAENSEPTPSSPDQINPKLAADILYWSRTFGVSGDTLHEAIRVHGTSVEKVHVALAASHSDAQHAKKGR